MVAVSRGISAAASLLVCLTASSLSAQSSSELPREIRETLRGHLIELMEYEDGRRQATDVARRLANGVDPALTALRSCDHAARNASGAPWLAADASRRCAEHRAEAEGGTPQLKGSVEACFAHYQEALANLEASNGLYEQARRTRGPQQSEVVKQAQALQREGKRAIGAGEKCLNGAVDLAVKIGQFIAGVVQTALEGGRQPGPGGAPSAPGPSRPPGPQAGRTPPSGAPGPARPSPGQEPPPRGAPAGPGRSGAAEPGREPGRDPVALGRGLLRGFTECGYQLVHNVGLAALAAVNPNLILENRNYSEAAKHLGVQSNDQGLRFLLHEITYNHFDHERACDRSAADEEAGLHMARRLCFWSLPNPVYKALKTGRPVPRPPPGLPGSATNPLTEAEVVGILKDATRIRVNEPAPPPAVLRDLSGKTLRFPPGQGMNLRNVTLGNRLGEGALKDVYAVDGRPTLTVQIMHHLNDGAEAVTREVRGYNLIKDDIPTPAIHAQRSAPGGLSYMIKERLPDDAFLTQPTPEGLAGMGATQGKLAAGNRVWIDGHLQNHYLTRDAQGRPVVGIHDTDMITLASDPRIADQLSRLVPLFHEEGAAGFQKLCTFDKSAQAGTLDGAALMRDAWRLRFKQPAPF